MPAITQLTRWQVLSQWLRSLQWLQWSQHWCNAFLSYDHNSNLLSIYSDSEQSTDRAEHKSTESVLFTAVQRCPSVWCNRSTHSHNRCESWLMPELCRRYGHLQSDQTTYWQRVAESGSQSQTQHSCSAIHNNPEPDPLESRWLVAITDSEQELHRSLLQTLLTPLVDKRRITFGRCLSSGLISESVAIEALLGHSLFEVPKKKFFFKFFLQRVFNAEYEYEI